MTTVSREELLALADRLRRAATTLQNDDESPPMSEKRLRHTYRYVAIMNAIDMFDRLADKPADEGVRPSLQPANIRAWMMATPFTQYTEWSKYVDHMLRTLSTKAKP